MRIRIVGAGAMGRGIAQWAASAGHTVELADVRPEAVREALDFVASMLDRAVVKGRMSAAAREASVARLVPLADPWAAGPDVELVIEAVREDLGTKAEVFGKLERALPASAVFATNTSSLSVTRIAATLQDPTRLAGLHFFNPVPLMRIVEVVPGAATRPEIPALLTALVEGCGHRAVTVADTPGFLVNHAGRGLVTEALALLEESVADPAEIDRIARDVLGLRMGPFELMDLTGLDVTAAVIDSIWQGFRHEDRLRPSFLTPNRVAAGLHGRKTGRGWYAYGDGASGPAPESPVTGDGERPVFVVRGGRPETAAYEEELAGGAGGGRGPGRAGRGAVGGGRGAGPRLGDAGVGGGRGGRAAPGAYVRRGGTAVGGAAASPRGDGVATRRPPGTRGRCWHGRPGARSRTRCRWCGTPRGRWHSGCCPPWWRSAARSRSVRSPRPPTSIWR